MKIRSKELTTCQVAADGTNVGLGFLDNSGAAVTVELPFEQAEAILMTIPHLLTQAVRQRTGNDAARYVFTLEGWSIESAEKQDCLIVTMTTSHGFETCFAMPFEACRSLGWSLQQDAERSLESDQPTEKSIAPARDKLN